MDGLTEITMARLVAPVVDRLRAAVSGGALDRAMAQGVVQRSGLTQRGGNLFGLLRATYPGRAVSLESWRAVFTYLPVEETDAAVQDVLGRGYVEVTGNSVALTEAGRALMQEFQAAFDAEAHELWGSRDLVTLIGLTDRVLAAALETPGPTLPVMAPPYDPDDGTEAGRLAERLTGLRFSRYDAHIAAWTAAGATAATVDQLSPEVRAEVERDTNRRAGVAYAALTADERLELLGGLAALRG